MKRSAFVLMLGLGFLAQPVLSLVDAGDVQAAVRKNVSEYAGQRCSPPPRGSGVIIGRFQGYMDFTDHFQRRFTLAGLGLSLLPFVRRMPGLALHDAEQIHRLDIQYDRLRTAVGWPQTCSRDQPDGRLLKRACPSRQLR